MSQHRSATEKLPEAQQLQHPTRMCSSAHPLRRASMVAVLLISSQDPYWNRSKILSQQGSATEKLKGTRQLQRPMCICSQRTPFKDCLPGGRHTGFQSGPCWNRSSSLTQQSSATKNAETNQATAAPHTHVQQRTPIKDCLPGGCLAGFQSGPCWDRCNTLPQQSSALEKLRQTRQLQHPMCMCSSAHPLRTACLLTALQF